MSHYPGFKIVQNEEDFDMVEQLARKLHCAMKYSGSQLINVRMFKYWLNIHKEEVAINENDISRVVKEDTSYGWSGVTNYCVQNLLFFPVGSEIEQNDVLFYEEFVVLRKVTIYDFKFDPNCCTAARDKCEAKEIIRMGIDKYNKICRPEILKIQETYYSNYKNLISQFKLDSPHHRNYSFRSSVKNSTSKSNEKQSLLNFMDKSIPSLNEKIIVTDKINCNKMNNSCYDNINVSKKKGTFNESKVYKCINCCEGNLLIRKFFSISPCNFSDSLLTLNFMHKQLELTEKKETNYNDFSQNDIDKFISVYQRLFDIQQRYFKLITKTILEK